MGFFLFEAPPFGGTPRTARQSPIFPENIPTGLGGTNLYLIEFLHIAKHKLNTFSNLNFTIIN